MENFKPTKKILITTIFMVVLVFLSQIISEKVTLVRNNSVYTYITDVEPDRMQNSINALEQSAKELNEEQKTKIKGIYYKHLMIEWLVLVALSYVASCLLFKRLKEIEPNT